MQSRAEVLDLVRMMQRETYRFGSPSRERGVRNVPACVASGLILSFALFLAPAQSLAQRGGGGHGAPGLNGTPSRPIICIYDCRDLTKAGDTGQDLKNFDRIMALQATPEQSSAFSGLLQQTQAAAEQLKTFQQLLQKDPNPPIDPSRSASLEQAIGNVRSGNQKFLASLSAAQQAGLKDTVARLVNADSDLGKQVKGLEEVLHAPQPSHESVAGSITNLDKLLNSFHASQLALGREMSVLPSEGEDLVFHLPEVASAIEIGGESISIPAGGTATRTSITDGRNVFNLRLVANLSDVQDNITDLFRSRLNRAPRCGDRIEVQRAQLLPRSADTVALVDLHHEHWACPSGAAGLEQLVASSDGVIEIQFRPSLGAEGRMALAAEITRVDAQGALRDSLLSGTLGATMREQVTALLLSVLQNAVVQAPLPPAALDAVTIQKVQFRDDGADVLSLVLDGELRFSDEQTKVFVSQLKQRLSAKTTAPQ